MLKRTANIHTSRLILLVVGIISLGGTALGAPAGDAPGGPADAPISSEKLNAYVAGYNRLLTEYGLPVESRSYAAQQIAKRGVNDSIVVSDGWIDLADSDLKQARALPGGGLSELDAVADKMIPDLDRLVGRLKGLKTYYATRANLDDKMARGKQEDPLVLQDFKQSLADMDALEQALNSAITRRDEAHLAVLKQAGDPIRYDGELAIVRAKALVGLFGLPSNFKDQAKVQRGDALVAEITAALDDETKLIAAAKTSNSADLLRFSSLGYAAGHLQTMISAYQDAKHATYTLYGNPLAASYHGAIDSLNVEH